MNDERIRRRVIVHGMVQGVGFRWSTAIQARRLDVAGSAVNRQDGSVEVVAEGAPDAVRTLVEWLHTGPSSASVDRIETSVEEPTGETGFRPG